MLKKIFCLILLTGCGYYYYSLPVKISISQNGRVPSTYFIVDHWYDDHWLWFKEQDGTETTIRGG